ncbi:MAG: hypothetical protein NTW97_02425, partial [Candidatus Krumholzibacteria bacterium]|nr:hypothetical protein [Candidatus Krumholzibacteria bacterium]
MHLLDERAKIAGEPHGEIGTLKRVCDKIISRFGVSDLGEVVLFHEQIKELGGDDGERGDADRNRRLEGILELRFEDAAHPRETVRLSAELSRSDIGEALRPREETPIESRERLMMGTVGFLPHVALPRSAGSLYPAAILARLGD